MAATLFHASPASANDFVLPMEVPEPRYVGLGVGVFPDYLGSEDTTSGVGPLVRLPLKGKRFVQLLANDFKWNLVDDPNWRFGVAATIRLGRDRDDIDDPVVSRIHEVDTSIDIGAFGSYQWVASDDFRKRAGVGMSVRSDVADMGHGGWLGSASAFVTYPVALPVILGAGVAANFASDDYMDAYFGVTAADSLQSGLVPFVAGGGARDAGAWGAVLVSFSPKWHVGAIAWYTKLLGDAKDSPIVSVRGDDGQFVFGVGGIYAW